MATVKTSRLIRPPLVCEQNTARSHVRGTSSKNVKFVIMPGLKLETDTLIRSVECSQSGGFRTTGDVDIR